MHYLAQAKVAKPNVKSLLTADIHTYTDTHAQLHDSIVRVPIYHHVITSVMFIQKRKTKKKR